jgi:uncharacterized membrane protein YccC
MPKLDSHTLLFSLNTFAAAMAALYIALALGLPRPYWAVTTAYIVSQPLSGAVRSKAVYRVCGTVLGGVATVALVPNLVNSPPLLSLALALWVGGCLTISLLDRTPRSYLLMLAGYTAALIGFPAVTQPEAAFDLAVNRIVEVGLGIICASLAHSLIFPRPVGAALQQRLGEWLKGADRWALDVLGETGEEAAARDRTELAAAASEIHILASHLPFDTSRLRDTRAAVRALHDRMLMLIPLLSGVADRLAAIEAEGGLDPESAALRDAAIGWIGAGAPAEDGAQLVARIRERAAQPPSGEWRSLLTESLMLRLGEAVEALGEAHGLLAHLRAPDAPVRPAISRAIEAAVTRPLHADLPLALLSGATAVIAILVCCALWIGLGWPEGGVAAMMTAVFCCFFAAQDDPAPQIARFGFFTFAALPAAAVYLFAVLPAISGFPLLAFALAPSLLVLGLYIADPKTSGSAMPFLMTMVTALALQETEQQADLPSFLNANLAQLVGVFVSVMVTRMLRSMSTETSVRRLLRHTWRGLADIARSRSAPERNAFAALVVDRLALLSPKLAGAGEHRDRLGDLALADLRVAMNLVTLQGSRPQLARSVAGRLDAVSEGLAVYYSALAREGRRPSARQLLAAVDAALSEIAGTAGSAARAAAAGLVGLRRNLFPAAPAFQAAPAGGRP